MSVTLWLTPPRLEGGIIWSSPNEPVNEKVLSVPRTDSQLLSLADTQPRRGKGAIPLTMASPRLAQTANTHHSDSSMAVAGTPHGIYAEETSQNTPAEVILESSRRRKRSQAAPIVAAATRGRTLGTRGHLDVESGDAPSESMFPPPYNRY